jgi:hypothetical protein
MHGNGMGFTSAVIGEALWVSISGVGMELGLNYEK